MGWNGKNLLNMNEREILTSGQGTGYNNTYTRNFNGNGIYIGMNANNYWVPSQISNYEIDRNTNSLFVERISSGHGIGFDVKVKPNTTYILSSSAIKVGCVSSYSINGEWKKWLNELTNCSNVFQQMMTLIGLLL